MRRRNSLRLSEYAYDSPGAYFVTICSAGKAFLFGRIHGDRMHAGPIGRVVAACWRRIPQHHPCALLDAYVVMPNHLHGILVFDVGAGYIPPLQTIVGTFKAAVSRGVGQAVWQRGYHDRVIRNELEQQALRQYIADNPLKWAADRKNPARAWL